MAVAATCYLRPLVESDVTKTYVDGLNDPVVNRYLVGSRRQRQTPESVRTYVRANDASETDLLLGIFIDEALRGTVRLHNIDRQTAAAQVGILLFDPRYWRQGWATRAIHAALTFASEALSISTFRAGMRADNLASRKTFAGLGFQYCPEEDWVDEHGTIHHFWRLATAGASSPTVLRRGNGEDG